MEQFEVLRRKNQDVRVQIATAHGEAGIEEHNGCFLKGHEQAAVDGIECRYGHVDLGLIEIKPAFIPGLVKVKQFIAANEVDPTLPAIGERVHYRGYPRENVQFHGPLFSVWSEGYTHFTNVVSAHERLIQIERREGSVFPIGAVPLANRDLHCISGSACFDELGQLRGIIWGGCENINRIFVCPARHLLTCVRAYIANKKRST